MAIDDYPLPVNPLDQPRGPKPTSGSFTSVDAVPGYPGEAAECAAKVAEAIAAARRLAEISANLTDTELTAAAQALAVVTQRAEAALIGVTADAIGRGTVLRSTAAGPAQWVERLSRNEPVATVMGPGVLAGAGPLVPDTDAVTEEPEAPEATEAQIEALGGFEPADATRLAKLAEAVRSPFNQVLSNAITSGVVNSKTAKTALDHVDRVVDVLPKPPADADQPPMRDQVFWFFLLLPPGSGSRAVRELTKRVIAEYNPDDLDKNEDTLRRHESVTWTDLPEGMVRLIADLSPDDAEVIKHAIQSLAAPSPASDCCDNPHHRHSPGSTKTGEPDRRTPGKRRADALLALINAGASAVDTDSETRTSGSARIVITMDFLALIAMLAGAGVSEAGGTISPDTVRRMACDAEIIPMVLGSKGEPLDVGRKVRLVDKGMRRAVIQRDKHCTYQGCSRPPSMCEVHHVVSWWMGGVTSLLNSALLCEAHHRLVHRDNLTATVTATGVTWHYKHSTFAA